MKLASPYFQVLGGAALLFGAAIPTAKLHAQGRLPQPLPEAVSIHRPATTSPIQGADRAAVSVQSIPTQQFSHGDPSDEEQYVLELINRARANPAAEGVRLAETDDPNILAAYQFFGIDKNKLKTDFAGYPSRPPLAFNAKLMTAARTHGQDMYDHDFQGHTGSNGSQLEDRLNTVGYINWTAAGENVAARSYDVTYGHFGLNVDWGVESQGHRKNIMNFEEGTLYTEIGISALHKSPSGANTGPVILTEDFGNAKKPYLLGVVYKDLNGNNFYDIGEGLAGVTVMPSSGTYYAVTSASGGYAIPVTSGSSLSVTASGGALASPVTLNATVGSDNVKLDFTPSLPSLPGIVTLTAPTNNANIASQSTQLTWDAATGATGYHLQVSTDANFATTLVNDSTLTATSKAMASLQNNTTYYWRVRAKNDAGWGAYSTKFSFKVQVALPAKVTLLDPAMGSLVVPDDVTFNWNKVAGDTKKYWIEVSTTSDMANVVARDTAVSDTFKVISGALQHNTTYFWHVRAKNPAGWGPYSDVQAFSTATSGVNEDAAAAGAFRLTGNTPNPFGAATRISFTLAQPGEIALTVLDGMGRQVASLASGRFTADRHEILWDASGVPAGVYYCQLRMGDRVETMKMMVTR